MAQSLNPKRERSPLPGRELLLWSAETGELIGKAMRHDQGVLAVAFSPDGRKVLSGSDDGTARLWSAETGEQIGKAMRHEDWVRAVAFSPDGRKVLTGSEDRTARLWSAETGEQIGKAMRHDQGVRAVVFNPDGRKVLTGSSDETTWLWSAETGEQIGKAMRHGSRALAIAFSPDGRLAVATTRWWLHAARIDEGDGLAPVISHILPDAWPESIYFVGRSKPYFLDAAGRQVQIGVLPTSDSLRVVRLRLDRPDAAPIQGDPVQLLAEWQRRLGLKINDVGEMVPLWQ